MVYYTYNCTNNYALVLSVWMKIWWRRFTNFTFLGQRLRHLAVFFQLYNTVIMPQHFPTKWYIYHLYGPFLYRIVQYNLHPYTVAILQTADILFDVITKKCGGRECPPKFFWHSMWSLTLISNNILPTQTCTQKWCQPQDYLSQFNSWRPPQVEAGP